MLLALFRLTILSVGVFAFYLACFLYEDEEGVWQNRIEGLWLEIYDRARATGSTTTALFNKVAEVVRNGYCRVFGHKLLSFQALGVSSTFSFSAIFLLLALVGTIAGVGSLLDTRHHRWNQFNPRDWLLVVGLVAFAAALAAIALLPAWFRSRWAVTVTCVPMTLMVGLFVAALAAALMGKTRVKDLGSEVAVTLGLLCAVILGFLSDVVMILFVRRILTYVSDAARIGRIAASISVQAIGTLFIVCAPAILSRLIFMPFDHASRGPDFSHVPHLVLASVASLVFASVFNITTAIFSCVPLLALIIVLAHRLFWPTASRLVYPLATYRLITNRKALVVFGAICFVSAFHLERGGMKIILRTIAALLALLAYYIAFFLYEDEQGKWQSRVDEVWVAVRDRESGVRNRASVELRRISEAISSGLDRAFGGHLISLRAIGVSTSYSFAGACLVGLLVALVSLFHKWRRDDLYALIFFVILTLVFVALGALPAIRPARWSVALSLLPVALSLLFFLLYIHEHETLVQTAQNLVAVSTSFATDVVLIARVRLALRHLLSAGDNRSILAEIRRFAGWMVLALLVPIVLMGATARLFKSMAVLYTLLELLVLNISTALFAFTFLVVLLAILLERLVWPVTGKLIYPLSRFRVIRNRPVLLGLGSAFLLYTFQLLPTAVKTFVDFTLKL